MVQIVGHYNRLTSGEEKNSVWDAYRERGISEEQIAILKKQVKDQSGIEASAETRSVGLQFTTDLEEFEYPYLGYVLTMHEQWERGTLPFEGPLSDQPSKIVEIMNLISNLKIERKEKTHKEHQREMEKTRK